MALIDEVKTICDRLAGAGWRDLLLLHGLDIAAPTAQELEDRLQQPLTVDVGVPGFEDFAREGRRGVEPGDPARSLLYHAFASPGVLFAADGALLSAFPTLHDIDVLENYIFAQRKATLQSLLEMAGGDPVAVVVFALEYRPAAHTCHRKHADLVFSRTGVSRVGTAAPLYDGAKRGFLPHVPGDNGPTIRVLPARYSAYLAVHQPGSEAEFCPMRFIRSSAQGQPGGDDQRQFWRPLHKLFDGGECLADFDDGNPLEIRLTARHLNEKLSRIHQVLARRDGQGRFVLDAQGRTNTGVRPADLAQPPFAFRDGIAALADPAGEFGPGVLVPVVHRLLVEAAQRPDGKPATFRVPTDGEGGRNNEVFSSSLSLSSSDGFLSAPEYVHVRHVIGPDGSETNLNLLRTPTGQPVDIPAFVREGDFHARHYVDFTGDGAIGVEAPGLQAALPESARRSLPAYSLVVAPDFFTTCDQREMTEWAETLRPQARRVTVWNTPPDVLSDQRFPANLQLDLGGTGGSPFDPEEDTVTAVVTLFGSQARTAQDTRAAAFDALRHSHLPDDAAGVFAPGWDVSVDALRTGQGEIPHLAAYGLGSPFPEDAKLCAALSTFWPAAAPDVTRSFSPEQVAEYAGNRPTVCPLTDDEIGMVAGVPAWDGVPGPRRVSAGGRDLAEYFDFSRADYVESALGQRFTLERLSRVDAAEYQRRVLAMTRVYRALGIQLVDSPLPANAAARRNQLREMNRQKAAWIVLSFRTSSAAEQERRDAEREGNAQLGGVVYRFELYQAAGTTEAHPTDMTRVRVPMRDHTILYVDPSRVIRLLPNGEWRSQEVP